MGRAPNRSRPWRAVAAVSGAVLITGVLGHGGLLPARPAPRSVGCRQATVPGQTMQTITVGSTARTYRLVVPPGPGPFGLILNFHGLGSNAIEQAVYSQLEQKGPQHGFVVATPQGTGTTAFWNIIPERIVAPDDVAFTNLLIDYLKQTQCIDPTRVDVTGISNGAGLSALLGCRIASRLAAIAPVAGVNLVAPCTKGVPLSVLAFHGTGDPVVPYGGGALGGALQGFHADAIPGAVAAWATRDRCAAKPATTSLSAQVTRTQYRGCAAGTAVELYSVQGGGHTWPGSLDLPILSYLGPVTHDINAADLMLAFFTRHTRPGAH
jgi:polyhydroxybutyrate depolymerase